MNAWHPCQTEIVEDLRDLVVDRVDQSGALGNVGQPGAGDGQCPRIAVDANQTRLRAGTQQRTAVSTEADGGVDQDRAGLLQRRGEERYDPVTHHRGVDRLAHAVTQLLASATVTQTTVAVTAIATGTAMTTGKPPRR
jgi:hypothetical protein